MRRRTWPPGQLATKLASAVGLSTSRAPINVFISCRSKDVAARDAFVREALDRDPGRWQFIHFDQVGDWDTAARRRCEEQIRGAEATVCLIGPDTASSEPVDWELRVALSANQPIVPLALTADARLPPSLERAGMAPIAAELDDAAAGLRGLLVEAALFRGQRDVGKHPQAEKIFDQYKLILDTAESLQTRRQSLHAFFMSINSLFLAAIGLITRQAIVDDRWLAGGVIALALGGSFMCASWARQIESYGSVSKSKFDVINRIESRLAVAPFVAEWAALMQLDFESFTKAEKKIPLMFLALYAIATVAGILILAGVFSTGDAATP